MIMIAGLSGKVKANGIDNTLRLRRLLSVVCEVMNVERGLLLDHSKRSPVLMSARVVYSFVARFYLTAPYHQAAAVLNYGDHTTCMHHARACQSYSMEYQCVVEKVLMVLGGSVRAVGADNMSGRISAVEVV